jgi:hypothetical protein
LALDIDYFLAIQGMTNYKTEKEIKLLEAQDNFNENFDSSIGYEDKTLNNGVSQEFIITTSNNKVKIKSRPNDTFNIGDTIDYHNFKWLVTEILNGFELCTSGVLKQCNHLFRFQNHTSDILEYWGVLEKFQASTDEEDEITSLSSKRNAILPFNDDTKKIFIGKKIFIETRFNKDNEEIPVVYEVKNINSATSNYGNGKLLELTLEEVSASENDSIIEKIADYISPVTPPSPPSPDPTLLTCEISGSLILKSGGSERWWKSVFYKSDGTTIDDTISPVWELVIPTGHESYYISTQNEDLIYISAANESSIIGDVLKLQLSDSNGLYNTAEFYIKVVSAFG